jgi:hypothetical protein
MEEMRKEYKMLIEKSGSGRFEYLGLNGILMFKIILKIAH